MIGIVVVTHDRLGDALIDATECIIGEKPSGVIAVSIDIKENADTHREKVAKAIKQAARKDGVLILTDMFGGTPSNLSYSFLEDGHVEVLSGVNLPMLIKAVENREKEPLNNLAANLETFGKKSITLASEILKGNKRG